MEIPGCRLSTGQRSFYYRGVSQWNALTADLKNSININIFKRGLFKRIFNKD